MLFALLLARSGIVIDVLNQALYFGLFGVDVSALIDRRQKTVLLQINQPPGVQCW